MGQSMTKLFWSSVQTRHPSHVGLFLSATTMTAIVDTNLIEFNGRVQGKTVLITGGGAGIGQATAKLFASYGAKLVIADKDLASAERTALQIRNDAREAIWCKCDVTVWEDLVAVYDLAIENFGSVDVVVANAGVGEIRAKDDTKYSLSKPLSTTIDVNLIGVLYTVHLAQHYLQVNRPANVTSESSLKSVVILGSMASWNALILAPMYSATKFAVLGLMRSLDASFAAKGIRIASIHPFFAATSIVPASVQQKLAGIPLTPVPRIAGTIFYAASHPDPATSGAAFWVPDGGAPTFMIPREEFKPGVYGLIDRKSNAMSAGITGLPYHFRRICVRIRLGWKRPLTMGSLASLSLLGCTVRILYLYRHQRL